MTAVSSATGTESTTAWRTARWERRPVSALEPGAYTLTDGSRRRRQESPIDTLSPTIADGKFYSFYLTGFTISRARRRTLHRGGSDPRAGGLHLATVRLVHASPNANPLTLYARLSGDTVTTHWAAVGTR